MTTPLLSKRPGKLEWSRKGRDIQGTIAGEPAFGVGRMLVGYLDNTLSSELALCWPDNWAGKGTRAVCHVLQNGITFQDGDDPRTSGMHLSLPSLQIGQVGRWVDTRSGYTALGAIRADTWQELLDSLYLLISVAGEVEDWKGRLKAWIERYQNRALIYLRQGSLELPAMDGGAEEALAAENMATVLRRYIHDPPPVEG